MAEEKEKIQSLVESKNSNVNIFNLLNEQGISEEGIIYLLDTLCVAKREMALNEGFSSHIRKLHIERLDKIIAILEKCAPDIEKFDLPENPTQYEKALIEGWRKDGYSDREMAEALYFA